MIGLRSDTKLNLLTIKIYKFMENNTEISSKIEVEIPNVSLPGIPEINIKFLNGELTIPAKYGGYVIAPGCGAGKTTAIKEIIRKLYNYGIVYSAFTIKECNEMYQYCKSFIPEKDMIVLHSETTDEGVDMNTFRNTPEKLADKKLIICTHYKLLNEYPEIFQDYSGNIVGIKRFSKIRRKSMSGFDSDGIKRYPRQLIIVDEMPTCNSTSFKVDKKILRLLGVPDLEEKVNEEGKRYTTARLPIHYTNGGEYEILEELYKLNSSNLLFNNSTESGRLKNTLALSMIYDNYDKLMNMDNEEMTLTYTLADHISDLLEMRILIFDGTGDLTFRYRDETLINPFKVLSYDNKYSSSITLNKIPIGYRRKYRNEKEFMCLTDQLLENLNLSIDRVCDIIKNSSGTLIVTWMNLKVKGESRGIPIYGPNDKREADYKEYVKSRILERGFVEGKEFSIIHYMSGLDKATNEFRDYDTIVFLGEFHVPEEAVDKFNQDYRVETDILNYTTYQLVQAVCRTRIRNHRGEDINIYYTDDWRSEDIDYLSGYLNGNGVKVKKLDKTLSMIKPKWKPVAELFFNLDPEIRRCVESGVPFSNKLEFTLDEIWDLTREVYPVLERKVKSYRFMIDYFKKLGIEIVVTSEKRGRFSVIPRYD